MVDSIKQQPIQPFNTIKYTTKDGENISATKKDGVVTLVGDKNGVRQMPLEDFKKELAENLPQVKLEKVPEKDSVEISKKEDKAPVAKEEKASPAENKDNKPATPEVGKKLDVAA